MSLERVDGEGLAPAVGYSHAVRVTGPAQLIFLAGQTSLGPDGRIVGRDIVEQFDTALKNVLSALAAAGGTPAHLASMTVYSVDLEDYRRNARGLGEVWRARVGTDYPAMAAVGVTRLWDAEALVELQAVAAIPAED